MTTPAGSPRRGEIRPYAPMGKVMRQRFVVVVSADDHNAREGVRPLCMDLETVRRPQIRVPLGEADPEDLRDASIAVTSISEKDPTFLGEPIGLISGVTLSRVHERLAALLDMPR